MTKILIDEAVVKDTLEVLEKYSGVDQRACDVEEALRKARSDAALDALLDKMADNARELGLSYEQPAQEPVRACVQGQCPCKSECDRAQCCLYTTPPAQPITDDTRRLDALAANHWDLRSFSMSDDDVGWSVIEYHMTKPAERTVAEVFEDDPRQAIDAAIEAAHGIGEKK